VLSLGRAALAVDGGLNTGASLGDVSGNGQRKMGRRAARVRRARIAAQIRSPGDEAARDRVPIFAKRRLGNVNEGVVELSAFFVRLSTGRRASSA
jgi:hypothetical protein